MTSVAWVLLTTSHQSSSDPGIQPSKRPAIQPDTYRAICHGWLVTAETQTQTIQSAPLELDARGDGRHVQ